MRTQDECVPCAFCYPTFAGGIYVGVFACFQLVVFVLLLVNTGGSDFHYRQSVALDGVCILADPDFDPTEPPDPTCKEATYWVTQGFSLLPALTVGVFSHFGELQKCFLLI